MTYSLVPKTYYTLVNVFRHSVLLSASCKRLGFLSGSSSPPESNTGVNGTLGGGSNGSGVNGVRFRPGKYLSSNSARSEC